MLMLGFFSLVSFFAGRNLSYVSFDKSDVKCVSISKRIDIRTKKRIGFMHVDINTVA
jgi:hypothetical protein